MINLFTTFRIKQSEAGHHVLLADGYPIAQGSRATISLNRFYWRAL